MSTFNPCNATFANCGKGGLYQLLAKGRDERHLIAGDTFTFWRFRYVRYSNFTIIESGQDFDKVEAGGVSNIEIKPVGHLLYQTHLAIHLPGIVAVRDQTTAPVRSLQAPYSQQQHQHPLYTSYDRVTYSQGGNHATPDYTQHYQQQIHDDQFFYDLGQKVAGIEQRNYDPETIRRIGKDLWYKQNFGGAYNEVLSEMHKEEDYEYMDDRPWAHWTNCIAQVLPKSIKFFIGNLLVDTLFNIFLFMWAELTKNVHGDMSDQVGKRKTKAELLLDAQFDQTYYLPLPFFFSHTPGNALAMVNIHDPVRMTVHWEDLNRLLIVSDPSVKVYHAREQRLLRKDDIKAYLECHFVFLDQEEQERFAKANFDQLVSRVQYQEQKQKASMIKTDLMFKGPCIELLWAVRRLSNYNKNRIFDFSGIDGRDPITTISLMFGQEPRFTGRPGHYYRTVTARLFHQVNLDGLFFYVYPFSLFPLDAQPSGTCNLGVINKPWFDVRLQQGLENEETEFFVVARTLQTLRYKNHHVETIFE